MSNGKQMRCDGETAFKSKALSRFTIGIEISYFLKTE
jgi:hypothetical protein